MLAQRCITTVHYSTTSPGSLSVHWYYNVGTMLAQRCTTTIPSRTLGNCLKYGWQYWQGPDVVLLLTLHHVASQLYTAPTPLPWAAFHTLALQHWPHIVDIPRTLPLTPPQICLKLFVINVGTMIYFFRRYNFLGDIPSYNQPALCPGASRGMAADLDRTWRCSWSLLRPFPCGGSKKNTFSRTIQHSHLEIRALTLPLPNLHLCEIQMCTCIICTRDISLNVLLKIAKQNGQ